MANNDTFQQYLITRWVPSLYRDGNYPGLTNLLQFMARFMDELVRDIDTLPYTESVFDVPPLLLPFLAELIDAQLDTSRSYKEQLLELRKTVNLYKIRGIPYSFYHVLKYAGATYYGIIQTVNELIYLDIFPMDSYYFMEGSTYFNPAIIDIYSNIDMTNIYAELLALVPAGIKAYFTRMIDFAVTSTYTAPAFVALPQLWMAYGDASPIGIKQMTTNIRVDLIYDGTIVVNNNYYRLDPDAGVYVYVRGEIDYDELPVTTFTTIWIYSGLTAASGTGNALTPDEVISYGTLLYTLTPTLPIIMNVAQREIIELLVTPA
jgi:hypothetical protein